MSWVTVRLELARTKDFPTGSSERGYVLHVPLDANGTLDEEAWRADKKRATVKRFWHFEPDEEGHLIHTRHRTWAFSYEPGEDDDEPIYHLEDHKMAVGEYITVREHDGESYAFKVISVR